MVHPPGDLDDDGPEALEAGLEAGVSDLPERRVAVIDRSLHGMRLDKALVAMAGEFSRNHLQTLIEGGHVWVDDRSISRASHKVLAGQQVVVELVPTPESLAFRPEAMTLPVVFEDEALLVVDKPVGLVVHPAAGHWSGTLMNGLLAHHPAAATLPRAGIVHRLDKDTSGLMVVGKTLPAVTALVRAIAAREVRREYMALAHGRVPAEPFRIDAALARDPQSRVRMAVMGGGKPAQTDVTRVGMADFPTLDGGAVSALRCRLHTGRTHQIRVHLASRGHPLLADALYGGRPGLGMARQALHAERLGFAHPIDGRPLQFDAPPPDDLAQAWQRVLEAADDAP